MQLDDALQRLLRRHIEHITPDLLDYTEILVVEDGGTEPEIIRAIGFSPLVEPIAGARFGEAGFEPYWDVLNRQGDWFEMIVTFGSTFACILLIHGDTAELGSMCRTFAPLHNAANAPI